MEVVVDVLFSLEHAEELFRGLSQAANLHRLTLDFSGAIWMDWLDSDLDQLMSGIRELPISDFTLYPSVRESWPAGAIAGFLRAVPQVSLLSLKLDSTGQTDESVASWVQALPQTLVSLYVEMKLNLLTPAGAVEMAREVVNVFGRWPGESQTLEQIGLDMRESPFLTGESKVAMNQALQAGKFYDCSLMCDAVLESETAACAGEGNCIAVSDGPLGLGLGPITAIVCVALMVVMGVWCRCRKTQPSVAPARDNLVEQEIEVGDGLQPGISMQEQSPPPIVS
jgi:hypothetical protein